MPLTDLYLASNGYGRVMSKNNLLIVGLIFLALSLSCRSFMPSKKSDSAPGPKVDFTAPGKPTDVRVELDKKNSVTGKLTKAGGTLSLTSADGSRFTLDVPANALDADTDIVMTAVKTLDGSPLGSNTPTAVQLEPSGLFFNELVTLTVVPAKEIPVKEQIIFGYEGDGEDYHLALIEPKSKEIKIKLQEFSGAGVGSGSDSAWAAHLQIQAEASRSRLGQELSELLQAERRRALLGDDSESEDTFKRMKELLDQYEDQVVLKERAAAELDCQFARKAIQDLITLERQRQLLGMDVPGDTWKKVEKLVEIGHECKKAYSIAGQSNNVNFKGQACGLDQPFTLDSTFPGGTAKTTFSPSSPVSGSASTSASGSGCTAAGTGDYSIVINNDGSGTLTWTSNDTLSCPGFSNSKTNKFTLPVTPAPEATCQ